MKSSEDSAPAKPAGGFVKLYRELTQRHIWRQLSPAVGKLAVHCLMKANWRADDWWDGVTTVDVPAGSFVTSLASLATECNVSEKQVRGAFDHLERAGFVTLLKTNRWTMVTIPNWDANQSSDGPEKDYTPEGSGRAEKGHAPGHRVGHTVGHTEKEAQVSQADTVNGHVKVQEGTHLGTQEDTDLGSKRATVEEVEKEKPKNEDVCMSFSGVVETGEPQTHTTDSASLPKTQNHEHEWELDLKEMLSSHLSPYSSDPKKSRMEWFKLMHEAGDNHQDESLRIRQIHSQRMKVIEDNPESVKYKPGLERWLSERLFDQPAPLTQRKLSVTERARYPWHYINDEPEYVAPIKHPLHIPKDCAQCGRQFDSGDGKETVCPKCKEKAMQVCRCCGSPTTENRFWNSGLARYDYLCKACKALPLMNGINGQPGDDCPF